MSIKFPKLIKEILKPLPKNDYPVLNTFLFVSCWIGFALDKSLVSMRDLCTRMNLQGINVQLSTFSKASKIREIEVDVDGLKIKASVSEQTMNQIQQEVLGIISSNPLPTDEQNVKAIQTYVRNRAEALEAKSIYKSLISAVKGEARESALKEFHNGSEVVKLEKPDGQSEKSQLQRYFESQM